MAESGRGSTEFESKLKQRMARFQAATGGVEAPRKPLKVGLLRGIGPPAVPPKVTTLKRTIESSAPSQASFKVKSFEQIMLEKKKRKMAK